MSISPQEALNKAKSKSKANNGRAYKPKSSQSGLDSMFKPVAAPPKKVDVVEDITEEKEIVEVEVKKPIQRKEKKVKKPSPQKVVVNSSERSLSKPVVNVTGKEIGFDGFSLIVSLLSDLYAHDVKFLKAVVDLTQNGEFKDVLIEREMISRYGLSEGSAIKKSREALAEKGLISYKTGLKSEDARRDSYFYSLESITLSYIN